jgi:phytoene synthase
MTPRTLDATYRERAIPTGSVRHLSWLFAAPAARAPLLGVYALQAEWNALMDPRTERSTAQIKLGWWQEEMRRLAGDAPLHPISKYLAAQPGAAGSTFAPLVAAIDAAAVEVSGAPLELAADLLPHAQRLRGNPLLVASILSASDTRSRGAAQADVQACTEALAVADYLARAIVDYRREARAGRVAFAVDELMAADIDNAALAADRPDPRLSAYLATLRQRAADHYARAARVLPPVERRSQRHLPVLAALGAAGLRESPPRGLRALYLAWITARRALR